MVSVKISPQFDSVDEKYKGIIYGSNIFFNLKEIITWCECHDGGSGPGALGVLDDLGLLALHDGHAGVGGAQVDADHVAGDAAGLHAAGVHREAVGRAGEPSRVLRKISIVT